MKKLKILFLFLPLFLLTGCSSYTELNELGVVSLLGIDYQDQTYHLYISIVEGEQKDGTFEKGSFYYESEAETLDQAFHHLYLKSNKKIYFSHMDTLLLTDDAINNKLKEIITYLLNQRDVRNNFEIIELESEMNTIFEKEIESKDLNDLIKTNQQYMGTTRSITFEQFLEELLIDQNTYLPLVSYQKELEIQGLSLIQDFKVLDTLSSEDTILFNILNNQIQQTIYQDTTIYKSQTNLEYQKDQITFHISMEVNNQDQTTKKNLEQDLKRLLIYYQNQEYDLMKLTYRMKQNHLFSFKDQDILLDKLKLKFEVRMKTVDNYLERELSS